MRDHFLNSLSQWSSSIPLNTQFIILFDRFPLGLTNHTIKTIEGVDGKQFSDITLAKAVTTNLKNQGMVGCLFATGFNVGSETLESDAAMIDNNRGFIQGTILKDRSPFAQNALSISMRDTNNLMILHFKLNEQ